LKDVANNIVDQKIILKGVDYSNTKFLVIDRFSNGAYTAKSETELNSVQKKVLGAGSTKTSSGSFSIDEKGIPIGVQDVKGTMTSTSADIVPKTFNYVMDPKAHDVKYENIAASNINKGAVTQGARNDNYRVDEYKYTGKDADAIKSEIDPKLSPDAKGREIIIPPAEVGTDATKGVGTTTGTGTPTGTAAETAPTGVQTVQYNTK